MLGSLPVLNSCQPFSALPIAPAPIAMTNSRTRATTAALVVWPRLRRVQPGRVPRSKAAAIPSTISPTTTQTTIVSSSIEFA